MEKCPHCERKFERLEDFPLIYIIGFERLEIPAIIRSSSSKSYIEKKLKEVGSEPMPREILELFQQSGKKIISHKGVVYEELEGKTKWGVKLYEVSKDITAIVKKAIEMPEIQETLNALESTVGEEWRTLDLLDLPGFKKFKVGDYGNLFLSFSERNSEHNNLRICKVILEDMEVIYQDLAELSYEGRINK